VLATFRRFRLAENLFQGGKLCVTLLPKGALEAPLRAGPL
jgi:hypothetical protein